MRTTIIHLSDLHIGHWPEFPPSDIEESNLRHIVQSLVQLFNVAPRPVIVITGDLVNDGTTKQFADARRILAPLYNAGFVVLPVPGNHDYGVLGNHTEKKRFARFKKAFFGMDNPHFPLENITYPFVKKIHGHYFIGLNSMNAETDGADRWLPNGEMGLRQRNDLKGVLRRLSSRTEARRMKEKVIVYLHHHPFIFPHDKERLAVRAIEQFAHCLKDGDEFLEIINGQVDVLLFGHDHEHINYSNTFLSSEKEYNIPVILACGKSTQPSHETVVDYAAIVSGKAYSDTLLGWRMDIDEAGQMVIESIFF
ncbi:MAG: metallophosphoesterase [Deltaproteobacteria bacterium]|nr:metallophosphoesterase [Deltaproteobacteria bacterium]